MNPGRSSAALLAMLAIVGPCSLAAAARPASSPQGAGARAPAKGANAAKATKATAGKAGGLTSNEVLAAMEAELGRSQKELRLEGYDPPYFISYQVGETRRKLLTARFGALVTDAETRGRQAYVEVRVGGYDFDSSGVDATDYERYVAYTPEEAIPLDDDPAAIRGALWLLTEQRYKEAITSYLKKKAQGVYAAEKKKDEPAFSSEPPLEHIDAPLRLELDGPAWHDRLRAVSTMMCRRAAVFDSSIRLSADHYRRWQVNTEGSKVVTERLLYSLRIAAYARADDGMLLENERSFYASSAKGLPDEQKLRQETTAMLDELEALRSAPLITPYVGPAILEPPAAGVLFHEAIGHRLEGQRQKHQNEGQTFKGRIGDRILPDFLTVSDDPTLAHWGRDSLNGHYTIDDEAVAARPVVLVENGVLRSFLMSRSPIEGQTRSNGHGRAQFGFPPAGRMGNLIISSSVRVPRQKLKLELMEELKRQAKPYGLIIGDVSGGSTNTSTFGFQAFKGATRLVWQVDAATGQETLVRGVEVVGTPLTSLSKVLAASEETGVFNGFCGAESGSIPVSVVAPAMLVQEIELQRASRDEDRGPLLPAPWRVEPGLLPPAPAPPAR